MIKSLIYEYGLPWITNRLLYSGKLKMLRAMPVTEKIFEKDVEVKKIDLFNINVKRIEDFLNRLSNEKKENIISTANNAIKGKILAFSSIELNYGNPINWHLNPITKVEVDKSLKWYQIPDFDPQRGDIKVIWEVSRFTHFFYLTRAYMIKKDRKYYDAFSNQLNDWIKNNPYSYGPNFKCGQEATLRMINALMAYSVFKSYGLTSQRDRVNLRKVIEVSYKKVLSNFFYAHKCIKNNHTLSEIIGLIIGAWSCDDKRRLKKAYILLDKEIQQQFFHDGGYIQYSFNYQRFALQLMELVIEIRNKTNIDISENSKTLIKNSALLMYQMQDESGDVPNYGPNDGALIFPVTSCGYRDFRPVLNTIYTLIEGHRIYQAGDYDEEILWFGNNDLEDIPIYKLERKTIFFKESGFCSLRHDHGFLMTVIQNFKTRPAQMDQLHIDLWHRGKNIFCDSGTYSYATDLGKRMALTSAHNTLVVQGKEQMKKLGPFLIYDWTQAKNIQFNNERFTGTIISKNGYKHTRSIKKTDYGYVIKDEVFGNGEYCEVKFHTPCEIKITKTGFELYDNEQIICKAKMVGETTLKRSYRSLFYLKKDEIKCISVKCSIIEKRCNIEFDIELK